MNIHEQIEKAYSAFEAKNLKTAYEILLGVLKEEPETAKAHALMSEILSMTGKPQEAYQAIQNAIALDPEAAEYYFQMGIILAQTGRNDLARQALEKSIDIAPNYIQAALVLGDICLSQNDPLAALSVFDGVLSDEGAEQRVTPDILFGRAVALKRSQQYDAAIEQLRSLPPSPDTILLTADIFSQRGEKVKARAMLEEALAHPKSGGAAFGQLAEFIQKYEGPEACKAFLGEMLESNPEADLIRLLSARYMTALGDMGEALTVLAPLDDSPPKFQLLGDILVKQGEAQAALGLWQDLSKAPDSAQEDKPQIDARYLPFAIRAMIMADQKRALEYIDLTRRMMPDTPQWMALETAAVSGLSEIDASTVLNDYDRWVQVYDLSHPPEYDDMASFIKALKLALTAHHDEGHNALFSPIFGGSANNGNLVFSADREVQDWLQLMREPILDYADGLGKDDANPIRVHIQGDHGFATAHSLILEDGGYVKPHVQDQLCLSGIYFLEDAIDGGHGHLCLGKADFPNANKDCEFSIAPKRSRLVLFPSYMWVRINAYLGGEPAHYLRFNLRFHKSIA